MAEQSVQFTIAAQDKATAVVKRAERALAKLQTEHYDATHSRREVEIRRVSEHYDKLAKKYETDARFKEQIAETSAARIAAINKKWDEIDARRQAEQTGAGGFNLAGLKSMLPTIGAATAAIAGMRIAIAGVVVTLAEMKLQQAVVTGDTVKMLKAELGVRDALEDMIRKVPLLGSSIAAAMRHFGDREGIDEAIANIESVSVAVKRAEELARQWHKETILQNARISGASEGEMARMTAGLSEEERRAEIAAFRQERVKIAQTVSDLEARVVRKEAGVRELYETGDTTGGALGTQAEAAIRASSATERQELEGARRKYTAIEAKIMALQRESAAKLASDKDAAAATELKTSTRVSEEKMALIRKEGDLRFQVEQEARRAAGQNTEADVADIRRKYKAEREEIAKTISDRVEQGRLLYLSDRAEKAALSKAVGANRPSALSTFDMGTAQSYRFLRSAPGQADPAWATKQIAIAEEQKHLLESIAKNVGITVETVELRT